MQMTKVLTKAMLGLSILGLLTLSQTSTAATYDFSDLVACQNEMGEVTVRQDEKSKVISIRFRKAPRQEFERSEIGSTRLVKDDDSSKTLILPYSSIHFPHATRGVFSARITENGKDSGLSLFAYIDADMNGEEYSFRIGSDSQAAAKSSLFRRLKKFIAPSARSSAAETEVYFPVRFFSFQRNCRTSH